MTFTDTHTHSNFSRDSQISVTEAAEGAMAVGLTGISITDHLDVGIPEGSVGDYFDISGQQSAIKACIARHGAHINIFSGIEVGLQTHCLKEIQETLAAHSFDIVIASVHLVNNVDPYCGDYYVGKSLKESYREYLEYYVECLSRFDHFDVMGHYDYISRWGPYKEKTLTYKSFADQLDTLFKIIIEKGKALELNTRSFLSRNGEPPPQFDPDVFGRYKELGGEMVTLGSDAHNTRRIGDNFGVYAAKLKQCGFRYLTHFKEREAITTTI